MSQRIYEMLSILPADLEDPEQEKSVEAVTKILKEQGEIFELKEWKKRRLAYPIKRKTEGVYHLAYFTVPSAALEKINMRLNQMETVLRHNVIRIDEAYQKAKLQLPFKPSEDVPEAEEVTHG